VLVQAVTSSACVGPDSNASLDSSILMGGPLFTDLRPIGPLFRSVFQADRFLILIRRSLNHANHPSFMTDPPPSRSCAVIH